MTGIIIIMNTSSNSVTSRREFLKASVLVGSALAAPAVLPGPLFAKENTDTLSVGLIGCGGRGSGAASEALNTDKNVVLTATGDAFEDQLHKSLQDLQQAHPDKVKVTPEKCFVGLDAYQKVINSGVDVVLLATPPGFRPVHLKAVVDAGKHIFCEKPMATDAPGVRSVLDSVKVAKEKSQSLAHEIRAFANQFDIEHRRIIGTPLFRARRKGATPSRQAHAGQPSRPDIPA
jgi:hypothetical protein